MCSGYARAMLGRLVRMAKNCVRMWRAENFHSDRETVQVLFMMVCVCTHFLDFVTGAHGFPAHFSLVRFLHYFGHDDALDARVRLSMTSIIR